MSEEPKVWVSIDLEAGIDEDWQECGLEQAPENADALLATIKADHRNNIGEFIRDWDLLTFVTVNIQVRKETKPGRWETTTATWSQP